MTLSEQIRQRRTEKGWSASKLARLARVSKGYISQIEQEDCTISPSAEVVYRLALALGTSMEALMGKLPLQPSQMDQLPEELRLFAINNGVADAEMRMLARIEYRGLHPQTVDDWCFLYEAIKRACR